MLPAHKQEFQLVEKVLVKCLEIAHCHLVVESTDTDKKKIISSFSTRTEQIEENKKWTEQTLDLDCEYMVLE